MSDYAEMMDAMDKEIIAGLALPSASLLSGSATTATAAAATADLSMENIQEMVRMMSEVRNQVSAPMVKIVSSSYLPRFKMVQSRFPKTKRARVRKKWRKDLRNFNQVESSDMYMLNGDTLICRPDQVVNLRRL